MVFFSTENLVCTYRQFDRWNGTFETQTHTQKKEKKTLTWNINHSNLIDFGVDFPGINLLLDFGWKIYWFNNAVRQQWSRAFVVISLFMRRPNVHKNKQNSLWTQQMNTSTYWKPYIWNDELYFASVWPQQTFCSFSIAKCPFYTEHLLWAVFDSIKRFKILNCIAHMLNVNSQECLLGWSFYANFQVISIEPLHDFLLSSVCQVDFDTIEPTKRTKRDETKRKEEKRDSNNNNIWKIQKIPSKCALAVLLSLSLFPSLVYSYYKNINS